MARSPVRRFFGTLVFLILLVLVAGFLFLLYAHEVRDQSLGKALNDTDTVAKVVAVAIGVGILILILLLLLRSRREKEEDSLFQPAVDQDELARQRQAELEDSIAAMPDIAGGPDVVVYNLSTVPQMAKAWDKPTRPNKKSPFTYAYAYPRTVERGVYTHNYITIDNAGTQVKISTLLAGPKGKDQEALPPGKAAKMPKKKKEKAKLPTLSNADAGTEPAAEAALGAVAAASTTGAPPPYPPMPEGDQVLVLKDEPKPQGRDFIAELDRELSKRGSTPAPAASTAVYYDYPGDVHDVIDIEGIGPTYAKKLQAAGVATTARLCFEDSTRLADKVGVPVKTVEQWKSMSELVKVSGIGPQYAEALARSGINGIADLKRRSATTIAQDVQNYLEGLKTTVVGQKVTAKRVEGWQEAAAGMRRVRQKVPEQ